ncbi:hypothetical protein BWI96_16750 [Siphonobacter sp. SORGH_AS_0500]|uniref:hypothetical protein n=1 Tax=Siphonobacter sp. SORGH_AS_0500 TaxID=1864824 RepID=UPI000CB3C0EF|nr:hypothetical protein [Siphonobacter sp. SORGH_AS_0500]PKK35548.1 hypothetical protein BWI96_16750 [Siphonobacter sp. SORGH_AS_0500]
MRIEAEETREVQRRHRNIPQLLVNIVMASLMVLIWGRATGKTYGATSPWLAHHAETMPRSTGAILCKSYAHMNTKVLQEIVEGWTELGYVEDLHFWVKKQPPEWANVPRDFHHTQDYTRSITWWNGTMFKLFSLDKNSPSNGDSVDFMMVEEAKLLDYQAVQEAFKTVRGNRRHFGHLSCHGAKLIVTDRPRDAKGRWVLDYKKIETDPELLDAIIECQYQIQLRQIELLSDVSESKAKKLESEIKLLQEELNELRKGRELEDGDREGTVYVSLASTLDNIHALGIKALKDLRRDLSDFDWDLSVLNKDILLVEDCFYSYISEERHGYNATNYKFIEDNPTIRERDCRFDLDVRPGQGLDVFFDHNKAINCITVGQRQEQYYRMLNAMYVLEPEMAMDLVDKFCHYYRYHPTKVVNYYYDNTSRRGDARNAKYLSDDIIDQFRKNGWVVNHVYMGQATSHVSRYEMFVKLFNEADGQPFKVRYNIDNCSWWLYACHQTPTKIRTTEKGQPFGKNKDSEDPKYNIPKWEATHITEAGDGLFVAQILHSPFAYMGGGGVIAG